jgi:PAS domain S-box-containing protein
VLNVLVIQDSDADFRVLADHMRQEGLDCRCVRVQGRTELMLALDGEAWDLALSDYSVAGLGFRESLNLIHEWRPDLPVILVTRSIAGDQAVDLVKLGLADFVPRDRLSRLVPAVQRALEERQGKAREKARSVNLAHVLERVGLGISYVSKEGIIRYNNPAYDAMFGYEPGELIGQHVSVLNDLSEEDNRRQIEQVMAELASQGQCTTEFVNRRKDGSRFITRANITALPVDTEVAFVSVQEDITERKRVQDALARASERNAAFLRNASDCVHVLDAAGNLIEASDSFCDSLGYSRDEVLGMNVSCWDAHFAPEALKAVVGNQIGKSGYSRFETRHRRKDGSIIDVEVTGHPLELDGKPVLFKSSRDITERKRLAQALEASEAELSAIFECSPAGIGVTRISDGRFVSVNDALLDIWGYHRDEMIGRTAAELGLWADAAGRERLVEEALRTQGVVQREFQGRHKSGAGKRVLISAKAVTLGGEPCFLGVVKAGRGRKTDAPGACAMHAPRIQPHSKWCREWDSNPHTLRRRILNPLRLPIPPSRQGRQGAYNARLPRRGGLSAKASCPATDEPHR